MSLIGNILWLLLGGIIAVIAFFLFGLLLCLTIIGIPFGIQAFHIGVSYAAPFGKHVEPTEHQSIPYIIINVLWLLIFGLALAIIEFALGVILCLTIIGIPFGIQHFKLIPVVLFPFGFDLRH